MKARITTPVLAAILICCSSLNAINTKWTWTGSTNSDYGTKSNWSTTDNNAVPNGNDTIIINGGAPNYPILAGNEIVRKFTMNGGSFNTNAFDYRSNTDFTINGGIFNAGTSKLTGNNLYLMGGTLTIDGNKMRINDDVVIDGGLLNIILNDALIDDDLFLTSGSLDLNGYNLTVTDEYTYTANTFSFIDAGTISIGKLLIDFAGNHTLERHINVLISAEFLNGILVTSNTAMLIFDNNASAIGASNTTHVKGPVRRLVSTGTNTTFDFPVGSGLVYAPISISSFAQTRNQDYFTAQYFNVTAPFNHASKDVSLNHISNGEYWILDRATDIGTATTDVFVRLSFDETNRSGAVDNASELRVARWDGTKWTDHGRTSATGNNVAGTFTSSARITSFSPFTIGSTTTLNPLPVSLLGFTAKNAGKEVKVSWATSSEINNDFFTVQKSMDGKSWSVIGIVDGVENSAQITNYSFMDKAPVNGVQFYRLIQSDINGQSAISHIVTVNYLVGTLTNTVDLFPNPANNVVSLNLSESASNATIIVFNSMGMKVMELNNQSGSNFTLDMAELEKGIYTIEIRQDSGVSFSKMLKN